MHMEYAMILLDFQHKKLVVCSMHTANNQMFAVLESQPSHWVRPCVVQPAARLTMNNPAPMAISTPPNTRFCARRALAVASQRCAREARKA